LGGLSHALGLTSDGAWLEPRYTKAGMWEDGAEVAGKGVSFGENLSAGARVRPRDLMHGHLHVWIWASIAPRTGG
jgi:hypothetical protein